MNILRNRILLGIISLLLTWHEAIGQDIKQIEDQVKTCKQDKSGLSEPINRLIVAANSLSLKAVKESMTKVKEEIYELKSQAEECECRDVQDVLSETEKMIGPVIKTGSIETALTMMWPLIGSLQSAAEEWAHCQRNPIVSLPKITK